MSLYIHLSAREAFIAKFKLSGFKTVFLVLVISEQWNDRLHFGPRMGHMQLDLMHSCAESPFYGTADSQLTTWASLSGGSPSLLPLIPNKLLIGVFTHDITVSEPGPLAGSCAREKDIGCHRPSHAVISKYLIVSRNVHLIQFHLQPIRRSRCASFFSWASMDNVICIPELSGLGEKDVWVFWIIWYNCCWERNCRFHLILMGSPVKCFPQIWGINTQVCLDH